MAVVRHGHKFSDTHPLGGAVCVLPFDTGALVTASATSRVWQKWCSGPSEQGCTLLWGLHLAHLGQCCLEPWHSETLCRRGHVWAHWPPVPAKPTPKSHLCEWSHPGPSQSACLPVAASEWPPYTPWGKENLIQLVLPEFLTYKSIYLRNCELIDCLSWYNQNTLLLY